MIRLIRVLVCGTFLGLLLREAHSQATQWPPTYPTPSAQARNSYSGYYGSQLQPYHRPPPSSRQAVYNWYYPSPPTVNPYLNRTRPQGLGVQANNYYAYVRPDLQRRDRAAATTIPRPAPQVPANNPYFNRLYSRP